MFLMCTRSRRARLWTGLNMRIGRKLRDRLFARPATTKLGAITRRAATAGFTMLEMMVVMAIMLILLGMAAGRYERSVLRAREATLHHDLQVMRQAIEQFTLDKQAAPQTLDDLITGGYLHDLPTDPM